VLDQKKSRYWKGKENPLGGEFLNSQNGPKEAKKSFCKERGNLPDNMYRWSFAGRNLIKV